VRGKYAVQQSLGTDVRRASVLSLSFSFKPGLVVVHSISRSNIKDLPTIACSTNVIHLIDQQATNSASSDISIQANSKVLIGSQMHDEIITFFEFDFVRLLPTALAVRFERAGDNPTQR